MSPIPRGYFGQHYIFCMVYCQRHRYAILGAVIERGAMLSLVTRQDIHFLRFMILIPVGQRRF